MPTFPKMMDLEMRDKESQTGTLVMVQNNALVPSLHPSQVRRYLRVLNSHYRIYFSDGEGTRHSNSKAQEAIEFLSIQRAPAFDAKEYFARKEEQSLDPGFHFPNLIERFQRL
jgi:thiamine pyrophosphate-dependent acetolactate synthase large subunit-like protein